jgi:hypothetical protein
VTDVAAPVRAPHSTPARRIEKRTRHLEVVDPAIRRRERRARIGVRLAIAGVIAAVLVVVAFRVIMTEGQLELERLDHQAAKEQQRYQRLLLVHAERTAPPAIVARARGIGMVPATTLRYLSATGMPTGRAASDGSGDDAASRERDWKKVKKHLDAQP